jgi:dUTP pyrophosphatase
MIKIFHEGFAPEIAYAGDAGIDLKYNGLYSIPVVKNAIYKLRTGLFVDIPIGYCGIIFERSGLGSKYGYSIHGRVIDAPYRGEIIVILSVKNIEYLFDGEFDAFTHLPIYKKVESWELNPGDKIAQMVILPCDSSWARAYKKEDLSSSDRGSKGLGSSGR